MPSSTQANSSDLQATGISIRFSGIRRLQLLKEIKALHREVNSCVRMESEGNFPVRVGLRQGCVMPSWLFNTFMD